MAGHEKATAGTATTASGRWPGGDRPRGWDTTCRVWSPGVYGLVEQLWVSAGKV